MQEKLIEGFKLSPQQRHLWVLQREGAGGAFRSQCAVWIKGALDAAELRSALAEVVARHEILRTAYQRTSVVGFPAQVITDAGVEDDGTYDLSDLPDAQKAARVEELVREMGRAAFDLEVGPFVRAELVKLSSAEHVLILNLPALCADAAGLRNIVREISLSYGVRGAAEPEEQPVQYVELSEWQNELLEQEETEGGRAYWQQKNYSTLSELRLPFRRELPRGSEFSPERMGFTLEPRLRAGLESEAERIGTTTRTLLLACWQILLWRLSGRPHVVVGVGFDGRKYEGLPDALGLFARYLPVDARLSEELGLKRMAEQLDDTQRAAHRRQEYFNWEHLEASDGATDGTPFFPFAFDYSDEGPTYTAGGLTFSIRQQNVCTERFEIKLSCVERTATLDLEFHFDPDLYATSDVQRIQSILRRLLEAVAGGREEELGNLLTLEEKERRDLGIETSGAARAGARRVRTTERAEAEQDQLAIRPISREGEVPLSFAQQRLWFLHQLDPASTAYNIATAVRLRGRLNLEALQRALTEMTRRHESLRTTFKQGKTQAEQVISLPRLQPLDLQDLSGIADDEREAAAFELITEEARRPFDLTAGPLLRTRLLRLGEEEHVALFTMHHIISDGWSMTVLVSEVTALYGAYARGEGSPLPELQIQYADYAAWQRGWMRGEVLEEQLSYWKNQLEGAPALLELPTDRPRPPVQSHLGRRVSFAVSKPVSDGLRRLSQREGVTMFMLLLAAFKVLLHRYNRQRDIVVGTPTANRTSVEIEGLIGFFVNTLVLRTDLSGEPTFCELLKRVREVTLGAYAHQETPFEMLVEVLHPARALSHTPLFQVMFSLQNIGRSRDGETPFPGFSVSQIEPDAAISKFDIELILNDTALGVLGSLDYNTDIFNHPTAEQMATQFQTLLEGIVADPNVRISELPLLDEEERRILLRDWNQSRTDYLGEEKLLLHRLFERQARRTPEAVAVESDAGGMTYAELDAAAERVARLLRQSGVGVESRVGVLAERSTEMVAALLGVMKAGGAYVPLEPDYPAERLRLMVEEACEVVLAQREWAGVLEGWKGRVLQLVPEADEEGARPDAEAGAESGDCGSLSAECAAYVIYTSGSTGAPKGVVIPHRAICNHMLWMLDRFAFDETDRVLQKTPFSFDASVWEFFAPLLSGARIVLARPGGHRDSAYLVEAVREQQITVLQLVPSMLRLLLEEEGVEVCRSLRFVASGGEQLTVEDQRRFESRLPGVALYNLYGPTEAAIDSTYWECEPRDNADVVPIGHPIANAQAYVLDERLHPVPPGIPGELHIGGAGLARGYLKRSELTAERFIPDPFAMEPGARLYRTGDLARYLPGGVIEFLERLDRQVKLRGFRVELGEIEVALRAHPAVRECAVLVKDAAGEQRLQAYVAAEAGAGKVLREWLRERLPEYMVPSLFVLLDELPHMPTGKVDNRALLALETDPTNDTDFLEPRTPAEETLADVWRDVLGVERIGVNDNFFELGGHSLLAMQVMSRVRRAFGVELRVRALFESPTLGALAERIDEAAAVSEVSLTDEHMAAAAPETIRPAPRDRHLPLSYAQQRLWVLEQLAPGSGAYHLPIGVRLRGRLNVEALRETLSEVVRRHESLRTTFAEVDGRPVQLIAPPTPLPLPLTDLNAIPEDERETEALRLAQEEAASPFDLTAGPLVRAKLLKLSDDEHVALFTMHHIISDGWSMGVLVREVSALYEAFAHGRPSPLADLPIQYADYAAWQRGWLQGEVLEEQLSYWRGQLGNELHVLELPTDRPRPPMQTYRGSQRTISLSREVTAKLQRVSRRHGASLFMTLLAGFKTLLHRYTGQTDITVGTPVANRDRVEIENLIGFFVNTLVLRTDLSGDPSFGELVELLKGVTLDAYAHQHLPFEQLVEELQPERSLSHNPLFQVTFILQNAPSGELTLPGLSLSPFNVGPAAVQFDITLSMVETPDGINGVLEYNTDLFDASTVERMSRHFEILLAGIASDPDARLSELSLLGEDERQLLVRDWNQTRADYAGAEEPLLHRLFERQAARTPAAVALVSEAGSMSYAELDAAAESLERRLRREGVRAESRIGVLAERSPEMVVALLGVMKAGCAYVPLEPGYPTGRLQLMCEDAGCEVVLAQPHLAGMAAEWAGRVLPLAEGEEQAGADGDGDKSAVPEYVTTADNLAYVIYTSGSTGRPKGVMVAHRAIANRLLWTIAQHGLGPWDRVLFKTPFSFDASIWELFAPLLSGATVVVARAGGQQDAAYLVEAVREHEITVLQLVPSMLRVVLEEEGLASCGTLRHLFCGGERLTVADQRRLEAVLPGAALRNLYGPTETAIDATGWDCERGAERAVMPIGRPIGNMRVYVVDGEQRPVPVGVAGELYVGGVGLARGYLGRPDLTAERFVPDGLSGERGARLYRTGDVARWGADGVLEYVGRADQQVKVRGFRIEPGEVEAAIRLHPGVSACVALVRGGATEGQRLEAYLVAEPGAATGKSLREWLRERLPEYMVPSLFVLLDELPLLPNGKLDRRALLQIGQEAQAVPGGSAYVAPRDPIEEAVAVIWGEVLRVNQVGVHDNFFELGGHSLLATRVAARLRESFDVELPLRYVFEEPTVAGLAARIADSLRGDAAPKAPPLEPRLRGGMLPLSFAQQRLWFLSQLEPDSSAYNVATALRLGGELDVTLLEETFNEIVRRHEVLRTTFTQVDGKPAQIIHAAEWRELPLEDLSHLDSEEREARASRLALEEAQLPFDVTVGPLLRLRLLRLAPDEHVVLLTTHHIVSDGWSTEVIFREVSAIYEALRRGEPSPLAEPKIQYADYALWQQEWLRGEVLEAELAYWKGKLAGAPALLELATDYPRPKEQSHRGATESSMLPAAVASGLGRLSRELGVTRFAALLAAFKVLLHRYTGETDIIVGTPIANRTRLETEEMVGLFVNMLALRTDLSGDPAFRDLAERVKETTLGAYAHQDTPFEKIVDELQLERNLSHSALFQVAFTFQASAPPTPALEAAALTVAQLVDEGGTSKFDLTLSLTETPEGLDALVEYSTDLFMPATVVRLLGHFRTLLEALVADPDARLSRLPLAGDEEMLRLLGEWNHTELKPLETRCAHELFEEHAAAQPQALAVTYLEDQLTYGELNQRANQLARHLRRLGVGPEVAVGLCFEQGIDAVVSLLAVSKAGGVYVPLDPAFPAERLRYMLEDACVRVALTDARLAQRLPEFGGRVVLLDAGGEELTGYDSDNLPRYARPENLMYVIYTSGSTGLPKGTGVSHIAATNHFLRTQSLMELAPHDRVLQFYSLSFDGSLEQIVPSLVSGACLFLREKEIWGVDEFAGKLREWGLTVVDLPSAYLQQFLEYAAARADGYDHVRLIITGGDVLPPESVRLWQQSPLKSIRLVNAYGPTEAVVTSVAGDVIPELSGAAPRRVPIGRPLLNRTTYILDAAGQPTPIGVPGELCIGGPLLARGYLNRSELTAEKFIPDTFSEQQGARLYKTGDRARYLSDGRIEFLGRVDRQIKVRGFRIEAGEIEATLAQHPAVREVAVAANEDARGYVRLVAYVVTDEGLVDARDKGLELWPSVGEYQVYDELLYSAMTYDELRNEKYKAAINRLVRDKVVLELGTGKDAVLARFCAEAGARKVYAVEVLEASYRSAKDLVASLGLADRIHVIHGDSFSVQLPEKVDVCVSEIIGTIGSSEGTVPVLNDARRFLKEGGVNIPLRCLTKIAAIQLPDGTLSDPRFKELPGSYARKVFEHVGHRFDVRLCLKNFPKENLISDEGVFEDLDFTGRVDPFSRTEVTLTIGRAARLDGFLLWINLRTAEGAVIDTLREEYDWLPVYFPAFGAGLEVYEGDVVRAVCTSMPSDNNVNPDYRIKGSVLKRSGEVVEFYYESLHHEPAYRQTEFYKRLFPENDYAGADKDVSARASAKDLRAFLAARLPQYMVPSAFVHLEKLPLTPSGKVDRRALPAATRFGAESEGDYVAPRTPAEETLAGIWQQVLAVERVGVHDNFFHLGGDSILSIQIIARANQAGLRLIPRQLFQHQTVAALAAVAGTADAVEAEQGAVSGDAPLTPIQRWFFASQETDLHHFNQSVLLEVRPGVDASLLSDVMQHLLSHHDALRLRFRRDAVGWRQTHADASEAVSFARVDLSGFAPELQAAAVESNAEELQRSLELSEGPIVRAALFNLGEGRPGRLLLVIHHLAVDGVSWRILLEDLHFGYEQLARGEAVRLAPKTTSFKRWAERLSDYAGSEELRRELPYWLGQRHAGLKRLPVDATGPNTVESARTIEVSLDAAETRALLQEVPRAYRAEINAALLSALAESCGAWAGGEALLVDLEGHGREEIFDDVDVSRTVGWFTTVYPVLLEAGGARGAGEALLDVKERLRGVPNKGLGYGVMKYLGVDAKVAGGLESLPAAEILFNYFGQLDQVLAESPLFTPARESGGATMSARHEREHLLEVNASVVGGRLRVAWTYSENIHSRETIERLADAFAGALRALVADSRTVEGALYTPSDFPLAGLDRGQLTRLTRGMGQVDDIYPLSPVQQGMYFHSLYPGAGAYVEQTSGALRGEVDVRALESAWQRAVERHAVLRTSFHLEDLDEPVQVVHARATMPFVLEDVSGLGPAERLGWLADYLEADRRRGFDLSSPPLMRVALVKTGTDEHQFVWTFHHLLLDGWSVSLLFKEVMTLYAALSEGAETRLEPPRQFGDYITWLRRQDLSQAESFWRASLRGFKTPTRLGDERAPGSPHEEGFGDAHVSLSAEATAGVQALARRHQLTLNTLLQGAWALVLSHYSGEPDVLFGVTVSGRPAELTRIETMVGMFINTLPVRVALPPDAPVAEWLGALQAHQAEMRQYEYTPLAQVQGWSEVPQGVPLFESLLVFENYPVQSAAREQRSDLGVAEVQALTRTKHRLTVVVAPGAEVGLNIAYSLRWFDAAQIEALLNHFKLLLESMAAHPDQSLASLPRWEESEWLRLFGRSAETADVVAQERALSAPPRTATEELLATIWADLMGVESVGIHQNFFDLGGHSLLVTQLVSRVRQTFQVELPLRSLFEAPTIAGTATRIEQLLRAGPSASVPPLERVPRTGELPVSFAQQRLWFLHQLNPQSTAYNVPVAVRLTGELQHEALERALGEIVRRHEVLRTVFADVGGEPVQVITPARPFRVEVVNLGGLPPEARESEAQRLVTEEAERPFDLARGPMLRAQLLRLGEGDYIALLTMHHIVSDGWSIGVLVREVVTLYGAYALGEESPLPEPPIQYADFAAWQRGWLQGEVLENHLAFWRRQLHGVEQLNLPTDRPRPPVPSFRAGVEPFSLAKDVTEALKALTRREGCTLFMTLLAAFQTLLHRYSGQTDIVVGTDLANRTHAEVEHLIGFFINMLAMRTNFSGNPTFRELLARVRRMTLEAYAHQDLPFEKLVAALQLERNLNRFPVFQAVLVLQNEPSQAVLQLPGLELSAVANETQTVKFDLILFVAEGEDGLHGHLDYGTDLFKAETMSRLMAHFETLLRSVVADPDVRVAELDMSTSKEREQQVMQDQERQSAERKKLLNVRRKAVNLAEVTPIRTSYLSGGGELPLVVEPNVRQVDLAHWGDANREAVEAMVLKHGAVLFRGFDVPSIVEFEDFAQSVGTELFGEYGDLPRAGIGGKVYGSTPYPQDQAILFHNESSHMHRWPLRIWFYCAQAAEQGGETPIVDCREVYRRLDPAIIERFRERKVMYVRNYNDGIDVSWSEFYRTEDRATVEEFCRRAGVEFEWKPDNGLRTRQVCEAVRMHPQTREMVFFNQIQLHHISFLEGSARRSVMSLFEEKDYPRNVYYGDGRSIEPDVIDAITRTYEQTAVSFRWQPGDILMLDNMLTAHARKPYVGQRKIAVAMAEMFYAEQAEGRAAGVTDTPR